MKTITTIHELRNLAFIDSTIMYKLEEWEDAMVLFLYIEKTYGITLAKELCTMIDRGAYFDEKMKYKKTTCTA